MTETHYYSPRLPSDLTVPQASIDFAMAATLLVARGIKRVTEVIVFSGAGAWSAYQASEQGAQALAAYLTTRNPASTLESYGPKTALAVAAMAVTFSLAHSIAAKTPELAARDWQQCRTSLKKLRLSRYLARQDR